MLIWILFDEEDVFIGAATSEARLALLISANSPLGGVPKRLKFEDAARFLRLGWKLIPYYDSNGQRGERERGFLTV